MIVLAPDFMTKICKKAAQDFHGAVSKVFDRVKSVALWSANIRKLAKDHKGYGSAATPNLNLYMVHIGYLDDHECTYNIYPCMIGS